MRFRNAVRILADNFSNVYKLLLFRLVTGVLFASLLFVIINLGLQDITGSPEAETIVSLFSSLFEELKTGSEFGALVVYRDQITQAVTDFLAMLAQNIGSIVGSVVGVVVLYLIIRFINGTSTFAMGSILNDRMQSYSRTRFSSAYFKNLGKSAIYQLIYEPVSFLFDILCVLFCWFFFFYAPSLLPSSGFLTVLLGLALAVTAFICQQAIKLSFISAWIPAVVTDGKRVVEGCKASFRARKGFGGRFSSYLLAIYLIMALNVLLGLATFGSMLFITIPASYLFILCLQFVYYYEDTGKKYFLSFRKISGADGLPETMED